MHSMPEIMRYRQYSSCSPLPLYLERTANPYRQMQRLHPTQQAVSRSSPYSPPSTIHLRTPIHATAKAPKVQGAQGARMVRARHLSPEVVGRRSFFGLER